MAEEVDPVGVDIEILAGNTEDVHYILFTQLADLAADEARGSVPRARVVAHRADEI